ncbi:MAG: HD domain-containing protein [Clostridia bacterium]|nr:HD domain-containing protein [Clostridia bacterium]
MIKCENYLRYFKKYTDEYFTLVAPEDKFKIELKVIHTLNVLKIMRRLAKEVGLTGEEYELAKIVALFHDFGRFNQIKVYGTFNDRASINHAEESVREMQRLNILDKTNDTYVPEYEKELIYKAILNHNRDEIVGENDELLITLSKLIRDADKIDIYRAIARQMGNVEMNDFKKSLEGYTDDLYIREEILDKVKKLIKLKRDDIVTIGDDTVWDFYWSISDMNYPISLKILKEKGYIEEMFDVYSKTGKFPYDGTNKEAYDFIIKEFYKRVENGTL